MRRLTDHFRVRDGPRRNVDARGDVAPTEDFSELMANASDSPRSGQTSRSLAMEHPVEVDVFVSDPCGAYSGVRSTTDRLCEPLEVEDYGLQSMPDASPVKWHLAHTAWFFETFVLQAFCEDYRPFHPQFAYLFNSYYETVGRMHPRAQRGLLSRPTVAQVMAYREHVDAHVLRWLETGKASAQQLAVVELGLHHEQQHQELIFTDLKHGLSHNAMRPAYHAQRHEQVLTRAAAWREHEGGIVQVGHRGKGFHFDNEGPAHEVLLQPFEVADRLVTCGEYLDFMRDDGYARPELWLSAGWATVQARRWQAPLYWEREDDARWSVFTLHGMQAVDPAEPVCHVSLYEADAFARWAGARLPSEFEWEHAFGSAPVRGNLQDEGRFHPRAPSGDTPSFGDTWVWTRSAYGPYPGYRPPEGALGEYNGKFMCSQLVLRGGSCVTPRSHVRATYRNFFHPPDRWQFSGIRLARDP